MVDLKRWLTTVLGLAALISCAQPASAAAAPPQSPQLVITSATFDESNGRLVIAGQNFLSGPEGRGHASAPPIVTLDLLPLTVVSATSTEIVASLSGTFPEGTYLITVSRGNGDGESGAFAVAIYHNENGSGQGVVGPAGPAGPQGPAGPVGPQGPAGPQGADGAVGPQGPAGPVGPVGPAGPKGADGAVGPQGPAGPAGANGVDGAIGPQGPVGPAGPIGPVGPQGATGATGPVGPSGPAGPIGPVGPQGATGATGPVGPIGSQGPSGPQGPQGPAGPQGPVGPQGPAGLQGAPGVSGYQIVTATANTLNLGNGAVINQTAVCPAGTRVVGGGVQQIRPVGQTLLATMASSYPNTDGSWFAEFRNNGLLIGAVTITVYAVCAIAN